MLVLSTKQKKQQNSSRLNNKNQEYLTSTVELSDSQVWLDRNYPKESRGQINSLEISGRGLNGLLNLVDFTNLEELYCYDNQLTEIKFATSSFNKLRVLHVGSNNFSEQDLELFSHLNGLEVLNLRNNNFRGDLKVLKGLVNLRSLDISDTNIDSGLIYLSEKLESLFCQIEKESECQKIKEALKDYDLGNDCYDFQNWWKDENWLVIPGSWPKDKPGKDSESSVREEALRKKEKFFELVDNIYQTFVSNEKDVIPLFKVEEDIEEFWEIAEEMKKEKEVFGFDKLKEQFNFDPCNLVWIVERYLSDNKKIKILEERIRELERTNELLKEKNEFWKLLQFELTKQNDKKNNLCNCWKSEEQEIAKIDEFKKFEKVKFNDDIKKTHKHKNKKNTNNIMTNNTNNINNKKIFILEWESAELKDRMRYENFKVIVGSEKGNLLFYSTFFADDIKFKKGNVYQLSTSGNFVEDTSGSLPGSFDTSGIIQGINNGGYDFEKVAPTLLVKELWEEKEESVEKLVFSEKELEKKQKDAAKTNQELSVVRKELSELQNKFSNLQLESDEKVKRLDSLEKDLQREKEDIKKKKQELVNSEKKVEQLQNQLSNLQTEKTTMESEWISPERKERFIQEKKNLDNELKKERRQKQKLIEQLEENLSQGLNDNIQIKLEAKKKEQEQLRLRIENKLGDKAHLLETLLEKQENFDLAIFEDVNRKSTTFQRAQDRLQDAKDKLVVKVNSEEIEELCQNQTEISKLEMQQKQWEEMGDKEQKAKDEQFENFSEMPPK